MKRLFLIFFTPLLGFGQILDYSMVKEMGICRDEGKLIYNNLKDEFRSLLPICSTGQFFIYEFPPNYYAVFIKGSEWCGSGGCHTKLYKLKNNSFIQLDTDIWGYIEHKETTEDYLVASKTVKMGTFCWYHVKRKVLIENDVFKAGEVIQFEHEIINKKFHSKISRCQFEQYSDSLPGINFIK